MSNLLWQTLQANDAPTWSVSLNSLASAAYSLSSVIDNTTGFTDAIFELVFSANVTAGATAPSVPIWVLEAPDGTNYASPSSAAAAPASLLAGTYAAVASAAVTVIVIRDIIIRPVKLKLLVQNNLGAAFAATTTANFYRFGLSAV